LANTEQTMRMETKVVDVC